MGRGNDFRMASLPNGLRLLGEHDRACKSAAVGFFVKTGSRDETVKESGVSHFLEHMVFKGTAKRSALDLTYQLGNIGAQANAYTSEEATVFYGAVLPEYFEEFFEILSDMMQPSLDPAEFDMERNVILEEIALYQDRPQFYLFEKAMVEYFAGHPAGNSVLGSVESISALSRDEMAAYFSRRYSPSNITLVAAGNFDWERLQDRAASLCGGWRLIDAGRNTERHAGPEIRRDFSKGNLNQAHVLFMSEGCSAQDEERYALAVLTTILGDSSGSKLYWKLIDTGLAEGAMVDSDEKDGTGCILAYASTEPDKLEQVSEIMREVLAKPLDFDAGDLERAKSKLLSRLVLGGEVPMGRLMSIGNEWLYRGAVVPLEESVARLKKVDRPEIERALERFPMRTWSQFRLLPE